MTPRTGLPIVVSAALLLSACGAATSPSGNGAEPPAAAYLAACTGCHGDAANGNAAPPRSARGATDPGDIAVGAHQRHLQGGALRGGISCSECHVVPASPADPGHIDRDRADVTFGPLATTGTTAAWNRDARTCTTYCHGASLPGGSLTAPVWTGGASQAGCGTCHGLPPPAPHPSVPAGLGGCAGCHPGTVRADGTIDVAGGLHVNGRVDLAAGGAGGCTGCHGGTLSGGSGASGANPVAAAPPADTHGNTTADAPGVGAHARHLQGGSIRAALSCADCHVVPTDTAHAAQPLILAWSALAGTGGVTPAWNATALTCTNYCHGATLAGGSLSAPVWTQGASQAACGTCHGLPPPAPHPSVGSALAGCAGCHPQTVKADGTIDVAGGKHVNGAVDVTGLSCTSCHGDATRTPVAGADANVAAAPPAGTHGETATSTRAVGAHQAHVNRAALAAPVACAECHVVPTSTSHADGTVNVTFGGRARAGGAAPTWNGATCASTYCHGSFTGGASAAPAWTASGTTCTSCHGAPPSTGRHGLHASGRAACVDCHGTGYSTTTVRASSHVNGTKDVGGAGSRINSWSGGQCAPACHGSESW